MRYAARQGGEVRSPVEVSAPMLSARSVKPVTDGVDVICVPAVAGPCRALRIQRWWT
jgi:hypothetical protein